MVFALVACPVAAAVLVDRVIAHPRLDPPTKADAVVVLGPADTGGALDLGERLVRDGLATRLVVSTVDGQRGALGHLCWDRQPPLGGASLSCFVPVPATTRGEARSVSSLVAQNHWRSVIVVTPVYHVARARLLFQRCPTGHLEFVAPDDHTSTARWVFESGYQMAAFLKAAAQTGC